MVGDSDYQMIEMMMRYEIPILISTRCGLLPAAGSALCFIYDFLLTCTLPIPKMPTILLPKIPGNGMLWLKSLFPNTFISD